MTTREDVGRGYVRDEGRWHRSSAADFHALGLIYSGRVLARLAQLPHDNTQRDMLAAAVRAAEVNGFENGIVAACGRSNIG